MPSIQELEKVARQLEPQEADPWQEISGVCPSLEELTQHGSWLSRCQLPRDIESVGMEYSVVLKGVQRAAEMLDAGETKEVSVQTERLTTVVRMLSDEYFVALAVEPGGNVGKARFLLRTSAPVLIENL